MYNKFVKKQSFGWTSLLLRALLCKEGDMTDYTTVNCTGSTHYMGRINRRFYAAGSAQSNRQISNVV